jgi:hypothetical protein
MGDVIMIDYGKMMMLAGIYLNMDHEFVSSQELQKEMSLMGDTGFNPELKNCETALQMLEIGGFLEHIGNSIYTKKLLNKGENHAQQQAEKIGLNSLQTPLWAGNI